jgi:hypothetical protein
MTAVEQRVEPAAPTAGPRRSVDLAPSGARTTPATRAAIAQATAFPRAALGTE